MKKKPGMFRDGVVFFSWWILAFVAAMLALTLMIDESGTVDGHTEDYMPNRTYSSP